MKDKNLPTLKDVAALAGVSSATVSRALNAPTKVSARRREAIERAIIALGYVPNFGGRALASNQTNIVGALIPSLSNAMFANGVQAFEETLASANLSLVLATTGYDPVQEARQLRTLIAQGASSILLIGKARDPQTLKFLEARHIPYVLSWCYGDEGAEEGEQTFVGFDNQTSAAAVARQALGRGHKNFALICGRCANNDRAQDRRFGFEMAIAQAGAHLTHVEEADYRLDAGRLAFDKLIGRAPETTVVLCGNDVLAAGALMAARDQGLSVPQDMSIIGFDDIGLARVTTPPLTTMHVPQERMGRLAAEVLMAKRAGQASVPSIRLDTEFVLRGSLAAPKTP